MDKLKTNLKNIVLTLIFIFVGLLYGEFNIRRENVFSLVTSLDINTPFIKWFIIPYDIWYVFMAVGLVLLALKNSKECTRTLIILSVGQLICYFIYFNFQTTVPRPILSGDDFLTKMVAITYMNDQPFNCFPSIHVFSSFSMAIALLRTKDLGVKVKGLAVITSILIILSTMFIKQHVILDAVGGIILSIIIFKTTIVVEEVIFKVWRKRVYLS